MLPVKMRALTPKSLTALAVGLFLVFVRPASSSGVLEVRVSAFSNSEARDAAGECCQIYQTSASGSHWGRKCQGACRTFFRACATVPGREFSEYVHHHSNHNGDHHHSKSESYSPYRRKVHSSTSPDDEHLHRLVDPNMPCSIGVIVTDVVANNSLEAHDEGILDIKFPFDIPWPSRVGIILEAWHDVTGDLFQHTDKLARLIARVAIVDELEPGRDWSVHWYRNDHIQLDYALRVECKHHYEGSTCTDYKPSHSKACVCKDDGHYGSHSRHKRDVSAPVYDLDSSLTRGSNGIDFEMLNRKQAEAKMKFHPMLLMAAGGHKCRSEPLDVDSIAPALADSVVQRLANMFAKSIDESPSPAAAAADEVPVGRQGAEAQLEESPVKALMAKLTGIINNSAKSFQDLVRDDAKIEGRQMMMRVASMINETVQAINPVLTFINALVTMLRATRYMLLMANFMG